MSSSTENNQGAKKGSGRKKIRLEKIENESNRHVTFSKRRFGLFKKANELAILCGAEVAILVISPGEKFYSYGSPSVGEIITRFVGGPTGHNKNLVEVRRRANQDQDSKLDQIMDQLRIEKKLAEELKSKPKLNIHNMSLEELQKLQDVVVDFQQGFDNYIRNNMNNKDKYVPSEKFKLAKGDILQYPIVEGHGPSVIKNMTGSAYREVLISRNHPSSLASSGSSSNSGPNWPVPHFVEHDRPPPYSFGPNSSSPRVSEAGRPTIDFLGPKCPSPQFVKPTRPIPRLGIPFRMVNHSGPTDLHGSGASDDESSTNKI